MAVGWLVALVTTIVALQALGRGGLSTPPLRSVAQFRTWLDQRDTPTAAFAMVRLGSLVLAWYLLIVTLLGLIARAVRNRRLMRLVDAASLPVARRLVATVAGLSLSASSASLVALPLLAQPHLGRPAPASLSHDSLDETPGTAQPDHRRGGRRAADDSTVVMKRIPQPRDDTTATMRVIGQRPSAPPPARSQAAAPVTTWTIRPGDSFWSVAHGVLTEAWRRPPTDAELMPYWRVLIARNRSRLVDSDNADLVYAGQVFELPPPPPSP